MAQLFRPYANVVAKTSLVLGVTAPVLIGLFLAQLSRSPANTKVNDALNQPIPFSHQHHVKELGIDCRYCHTTVETSSFAGLPPTETCMSCHSQIWTNSPLLEPVRQSYETGTPIVWTRVNDVPEFVNFNHSIHVNRGINCNNCHGPVQEMQITMKGQPLQMQWCLECHRSPERYLYANTSENDQSPRQRVFKFYWKLQEQGHQGLTPREEALAAGHEQYSSDPAEIDEGKRLVKQYGVKVQQLSDCSVCHY